MLSYETYAHAKDLINVKELKSITMKGILREVKVFEIIGRKKTNTNKTSKNNTQKVLSNKETKNINKQILAINKQFKYLETLIKKLNNK